MSRGGDTNNNNIGDTNHESLYDFKPGESHVSFSDDDIKPQRPTNLQGLRRLGGGGHGTLPLGRQNSRHRPLMKVNMDWIHVDDEAKPDQGNNKSPYQRRRRSSGDPYRMGEERERAAAARLKRQSSSARKRVTPTPAVGGRNRFKNVATAILKFTAARTDAARRRKTTAEDFRSSIPDDVCLASRASFSAVALSPVEGAILIDRTNAKRQALYSGVSIGYNYSDDMKTVPAPRVRRSNSLNDVERLEPITVPTVCMLTSHPEVLY